MLRAVTYCRCSTEEESQQDALKQQVTEARNAVCEKGWLLVHEFVEARSGTSVEKRGEYQKLYEGLQESGFDIVVIKSQDRLMRNTKDWYLFVDRLVTNGKQLYMYLENKFYSADDSLITGIKAILAEDYSRELSKKINNAHKNRQKTGKSLIIPPQTYGIKKISKMEYELVEEEVQAIRLMFHLAKYHGCGVIQQVLEEQGFQDRDGRPYKEETIRRIIRNPIRCGTVIQNKKHYDFQQKKEIKLPEKDWIIHKNAVPACVTEEEWKEANEAMDERARARNIEKYCPKSIHRGKYELSGKIRCGLCGAMYYRRYRKRYQDGKYIIEWKCSNYLSHGKKVCDNITLNEVKTFEILTQLCERYNQTCQVDSSGIIEQVLSLLRGIIDTHENAEQRKKLQGELERTKDLQEKLLNKLLSDTITDDVYKRKKKELEIKTENLLKELNSFQSMEEAQVLYERRLAIIYGRLESDIAERAIILEMLDNIRFMTVYPKYFEVNFAGNKLSGNDTDASEIIDQPTKETEETFLIKVPFPSNFTYKDQKALEREQIVQYMKDNPYITAKEIAEKEGTGLSGINYRIKILRQEGRIYFDGAGGKGKWIVVDNKE